MASLVFAAVGRGLVKFGAIFDITPYFQALQAPGQLTERTFLWTLLDKDLFR